MPRINNLRRNKGEVSQKTKCAALFMILSMCDGYALIKKGNSIVLTCEKQGYKTRITAADEFALPQLLGDWVVALPKWVWNKSIDQPIAVAAVKDDSHPQTVIPGFF